MNYTKQCIDLSIITNLHPQSHSCAGDVWRPWFICITNGWPSSSQKEGMRFTTITHHWNFWNSANWTLPVSSQQNSDHYLAKIVDGRSGFQIKRTKYQILLKREQSFLKIKIFPAIVPRSRPSAYTKVKDKDWKKLCTQKLVRKFFLCCTEVWCLMFVQTAVQIQQYLPRHKDVYVLGTKTSFWLSLIFMLKVKICKWITYPSTLKH